MSRIRPRWLRNAEVGKGKVLHNGKEYPYTIVATKVADRDDGKTLSLFVGYFQLEHLFISEAIPAEFRQYVLLHELRQFHEFLGQSNSIKSALISELSEVPLDQLERYLPFRKKYFEELINYHKGGSPRLLNRLKKSLKYIVDFSSSKDPIMRSIAELELPILSF